MRVLVCGGRDYRNKGVVRETLATLTHETPITCVISGNCRGADQFAEEWAADEFIPTALFRAAWGELGKAAGPLRNQKMIDEGKPALVVAFPGGRGTADMVRRARAAGIKVLEVTR